jgi:hypothetical protein|eukprot:COSAG01_NODE_3741_length_5745_cov_23.297202_4_plen_173_part_00
MLLRCGCFFIHTHTHTTSREKGRIFYIAPMAPEHSAGRSAVGPNAVLFHQLISRPGPLAIRATAVGHGALAGCCAGSGATWRVVAPYSNTEAAGELATAPLGPISQHGHHIWLPRAAGRGWSHTGRLLRSGCDRAPTPRRFGSLTPGSSARVRCRRPSSTRAPCGPRGPSVF